MRRRRFLAVGAGTGAWALAGCSTGDGTGRAPAQVSAAPRSPEPIGPLPAGVTFHQHTTRLRAAGPLRHQMLSVSPSAQVRVSAVHGSRLDTAETVRAMANRVGAVAAVNASFFDIATSAVFSGYDGDPLGLYVENNAMLSEAANGRTALVLGEDGGTTRIVEARSVSTVTDSHGARRTIDGVNRMPGRIVGCGGVGGDVLRGTRGVRTAPAHNKLCEDQDELVLFTRQWGRAAAAAGPGSTEAVIASDGRVVQLRSPGGGPIPARCRVLTGIGEGAAWLRRHARTGATLRITSQVHDGAGRRISGRGLTVVQAGPRLLRDGAPDIDIEANGIPVTALTQRHPRTLTGITDDGTLLLVTVDGRDPGASVGVTLKEAAELMRSLGARDAMNLDGGGSTTMVVNGRLRNRPRGAAGAPVRERPVANALVVLPR
ncbi:phosphodiester glycosidase family protein [Streptomyces sp. NBC_01241]|uniref:phosphodiester glycosidase family protein n=1 Tax=Streptomyces sp. NBC_01241 TaxID=2903794 RepID=UPI00352C00CA|nr:phosphodiester glycosidase family protein [Streptomyces sp. NBC_01241]